MRLGNNDAAGQGLARQRVDRWPSLGLNYRAVSARMATSRRRRAYTDDGTAAACRLLQARAPHTSTPLALRRCPSRSEPARCTRTGISATDVRRRASTAGARRRVAIALRCRSRPPARRFRHRPTLHLPQQKRPGLPLRGSSAARARQRSKPSSAASSARVTSESRTRSCLSAREASSPRMWRADAEAMRSPVNRTMPLRALGREAGERVRRRPRAVPDGRRSTGRPGGVRAAGRLRPSNVAALMASTVFDRLARSISTLSAPLLDCKGL